MKGTATLSSIHPSARQPVNLTLERRPETHHRDPEAHYHIRANFDMKHYALGKFQFEASLIKNPPVTTTRLEEGYLPAASGDHINVTTVQYTGTPQRGHSGWLYSHSDDGSG